MARRSNIKMKRPKVFNLPFFISRQFTMHSNAKLVNKIAYLNAEKLFEFS